MPFHKNKLSQSENVHTKFDTIGEFAEWRDLSLAAYTWTRVFFVCPELKHPSWMHTFVFAVCCLSSVIVLYYSKHV